jgi:2,3-dihydroxybenzoate decarboxylase
MRYIALEEALFIPELAERQPRPQRGVPRLPSRFKSERAESYQRRPADFNEYRLPEMDDASIDWQVLSLTVPGLQVDIEPELARENARLVNDHVAKVVCEYPNRFRAVAALPLQDPAAGAAELERAVTELGFCGALVSDYVYGERSLPSGQATSSGPSPACGVPRHGRFVAHIRRRGSGR